MSQSPNGCWSNQPKPGIDRADNFLALPVTEEQLEIYSSGQGIESHFFEGMVTGIFPML